MHHLRDLYETSSISPVDTFRCYYYGYRQAVASAVETLVRYGALSEQAGKILDGIISVHCLSTRGLRWKFNLRFHDLSNVPDLHNYLNLGSLEDYFYSLGFRFGLFMLTSAHTSIISENIFSMPYEDYLPIVNMINITMHHKIDLDMVRKVTTVLVQPPMEAEMLPLIYLNIARSDKTSQTFDAALKSDENAFVVYMNYPMPTVRAASEEQIPGLERYPIISKLSLPEPTLDSIAPKNPAQNHVFFEVIRKNPAYGMTFWELVRTIAKDHGAGFIPHPDTTIEALIEKKQRSSRHLLSELSAWKVPFCTGIEKNAVDRAKLSSEASRDVRPHRIG